MELQDVRDVIDHHTGRARAVLQYSLVVGDVLATASEPGFSVDSWAPLAALLDTERFERIGNFKEIVDWSEYAAFLTRWAPDAAWDCSFKRITEAGDLVFLELEERTTTDGVVNAVNSLSVYEFDATDRIHRIHVYLQMPIPKEFLPAAYGEVRISS